MKFMPSMHSIIVLATLLATGRCMDQNKSEELARRIKKVTKTQSGPEMMEDDPTGKEFPRKSRIRIRELGNDMDGKTATVDGFNVYNQKLYLVTLDTTGETARFPYQKMEYADSQQFSYGSQVRISNEIPEIGGKTATVVGISHDKHTYVKLYTVLVEHNGDKVQCPLPARELELITGPPAIGDTVESLTDKNKDNIRVGDQGTISEVRRTKDGYKTRFIVKFDGGFKRSMHLTDITVVQRLDDHVKEIELQITDLRKAAASDEAAKVKLEQMLAKLL